MNCGKNQNGSYSYTQRKIHVSLQNHLPDPGWERSFPRCWECGCWLTAVLWVSLKDLPPRGHATRRGQAIPNDRAVEAKARSFKWGLPAPKHAMGSAEDFTARRLRCLSASAPPVGPPSPRPAPRPAPTSAPGCWQSTFHTPACSAGFAPRALRRAHVPASGACSSTRPVFGAQLFWKVVLAYFVQHFYLFMVERGICVSSVRQVSRNKSVLKFLNLLRFSISIAFSLFAASSRSILKLQIFTNNFHSFPALGGLSSVFAQPFHKPLCCSHSLS